MASLGAQSAAKEPTTAGRVESARSPLGPGLGRTPQSPDVSPADRCLRTAPDRRPAAAGLGHRRTTDAGTGARWQRRERPARPNRPQGVGVVASVLAVRTAPPLAVPSPAPADAPVPHLPPQDLHSGGAPAWH